MKFNQPLRQYSIIMFGLVAMPCGLCHLLWPCKHYGGVLFLWLCGCASPSNNTFYSASGAIIFYLAPWLRLWRQFSFYIYYLRQPLSYTTPSGLFASCSVAHSYLGLQSFRLSVLVLLFLWPRVRNSLLHPFWCSLWFKWVCIPLIHYSRNDAFWVGISCWMPTINLLNRLFHSLFAQWSRILTITVALFQAIITHSSIGTSHFKRTFNKFKDHFQESSQDWPIVLLDNWRVQPGQHNSLAFLMASIHLTFI